MDEFVSLITRRMLLCMNSFIFSLILSMIILFSVYFSATVLSEDSEQTSIFPMFTDTVDTTTMAILQSTEGELLKRISS